MYYFFDLDDTLIVTQETYVAINIKTAGLVRGILGEKETVENILAMMEKIDIKNSAKYGFIMERFPKSWVETLNLFADIYDVHTSKDEEMWVYDSANNVYETVLPLYEDTISALDRISKLGHPMIIMTAGETKVQEKRIMDSNLKHYFDEVHVVPTKNPDIFRKVLGTRNPQECVMIGNSLKSDIYPALEMNMYAVHLQRETWAYDRYEIDTSNPRYFGVQNLSEACLILEGDFPVTGHPKKTQ